MRRDGLRPAINAAGGLHTRADLAERWGISRERVRQITCEAGFPRPIRTAGGLELWTADEADAYRKGMRRAPAR